MGGMWEGESQRKGDMRRGMNEEGGRERERERARERESGSGRERERERAGEGEGDEETDLTRVT